MTPGARAAAAIAVLDRWLAGTPVEQALTNWGRASRYAGSGDRHAVRDLVYEAVRCRSSFAHRGGAETGRGLILGGLRYAGGDVDHLFNGAGHAPPTLGTAESIDPGPAQGLVALDCPDWLAPYLQRALGPAFAPVMTLLRQRAPVFLRVNIVQATRDQAQARLAAEGIVTVPHALARTALHVTEGARKIHTSGCYATGLVELQDAASQAVVQALQITPSMRVLDYCAGGGGKALAMAAMGAQVSAHDVDAGRMRDLPNRAARAHASVEILGPGRLQGPYDLVLVDAPCSGSGSWRRAPEGKWTLTPAKLASLLSVQAGVLDTAQGLVAADGCLAYATCTMIEDENAGQISEFLARHPDWKCLSQHSFTPLDGGDGFFLAQLSRVE